MSFTYLAYGLGIHSALPLPELVAKEISADVIIRLGKVDCPELEIIDAYRAFWATAEEACYASRGIGIFRVRGGREIIVDPVPDVDERVLRRSLLGPVLALILHQRGRFLLHASAVAVAGRVIAFVGRRGRGKSTTAAILHARGHDMVTDDVLAIDRRHGASMAIPSFPQFKLWPKSFAALGENPEAWPLLHPAFEKRARPITQGFAPTSLPLIRLYVLDDGPSLQIDPLSPQEALRELMGHWYGTRFGKPLLQAGGVASHFRQCASLANQVSICRLTKPSCLAALPKLAQLVEEDLVRITTS